MANFLPCAIQDPFALIIFIPFVDLVLYPALRKANIRFTPIKKIFAGFMLGCSAMIWVCHAGRGIKSFERVSTDESHQAAVTQYYIYKTS